MRAGMLHLMRTNGASPMVLCIIKDICAAVQWTDNGGALF
jgi:hypothetical protein